MEATRPMSIGRTRRRRGFAFGGFVLLTGILLLLGGVGQLPEGFWFALLPLWPVLVIAPGLNLVLSRVKVVLGSGAALAALVAVVVGAWMMAPTGWDTTTYVHRQSVPARVVDQTILRLKLPVGALNLFGGRDRGLAVEGEYSLRLKDERVGVASSVAAGRLEIDIESPLTHGDWDFGGVKLPGDAWEEWILVVNPEVETRVDYEGGVGRLKLDLSDMQVRDVDIRVGVAEVDMKLPAAGRSEARLEVGVCDIEIEIPEGMAARISIRGGVAGVDIDKSRFSLYSEHGDGFWIFDHNREYRTADWSTAENRVDLRIEVGVGQIRVR